MSKLNWNSINLARALQIYHVISKRDCLWASSNIRMWSLLKRMRDDAVLVIFPDRTRMPQFLSHICDTHFFNFTLNYFWHVFDLTRNQVQESSLKLSTSKLLLLPIRRYCTIIVLKKSPCSPLPISRAFHSNFVLGSWIIDEGIAAFTCRNI